MMPSPHLALLSVGQLVKQTGKQVSNHNSIIGEERRQKGLRAQGRGERGRPGSGGGQEDLLRKGKQREKRETRTNNRELAGHSRQGWEAGVFKA